MASMEAGRELDALVAEKVMGFELLEGGRWRTAPHQVFGRELPNFSADIAAAMQVVEKIGKTWRGFPFLARWHSSPGFSGEWVAEWVEFHHEGFESRCHGAAASLPHAICLAALEVAKAEGRL